MQQRYFLLILHKNNNHVRHQIFTFCVKVLMNCRKENHCTNSPRMLNCNLHIAKLQICFIFAH